MTPDERPRRHHLADGPLSSLYAPSPSLSSFGAASVMMCCSARPASSSAQLELERIPTKVILDGLKRNMSRGNSLSDELDLSSVLSDTRPYLYSPVRG